MPDFFDENLPYYLMIFGSVVMAVQSTFGMLRQSGNTRKVNHRLKVSDGSKSISEVILRLRRERGLTEDGEIQSGFEYFNRLITRSGMAIKLYHLGIFAALVAAVVGGAVFYFAESILFPLASASPTPCRLSHYLAAAKRERKIGDIEQTPIRF